jgi:magnesium chelatase family protein
VASANPCPCGFRDSGVRECSCTDATVARYAARVQWAATQLGLSITAPVQPVALDVLRGPEGESSASIAGRIAASAPEGT